jgi:hypothetical protein
MAAIIKKFTEWALKNKIMAGALVLVIVAAIAIAAGFIANPMKSADGYVPPPPPLENYTQTSSVTCDLNQVLAKSRDEFGNIVFDCVDAGGAENFSPIQCPDPKNITRRTLPNGAVLLACGNTQLENQAINNEGFGLVPGKTCQFKQTQRGGLGIQQTCIPLPEFSPIRQETFGVIDIQQPQEENFEFPKYMQLGNGSTFGRRENFEEPSFSAGGYGGIDIKPNLNPACTNSQRLVAVQTGQGVTDYQCQPLN